MQHRLTAFGGVLLLLLLVVSGCAEDDVATDATTTTAPVVAPETTVTTTTAETSTSTPASTAAPTTATTATTGAPASSKPTVVLKEVGLAFRSGPSTIRYLEMDGTDAATLRSALVEALGAPVEEADQECPSGPARSMRWSAITVYVSGGAFSGWFVRPGAKPALRFANGIGLGSTLAKVQSSYPDMSVEETSLGTEFSSGRAIGGLLTSNASSGTVTTLFSGDACIQR